MLTIRFPLDFGLDGKEEDYALQRPLEQISVVHNLARGGGCCFDSLVSRRRKSADDYYPR
jgi:hypothetical protein